MSAKTDAGRARRGGPFRYPAWRFIRLLHVCHGDRMRDALLAVVIIAVLVFLDRREDRGVKRNPLRSPWRGKAPDPTASWRAPWAAGDDDARQDDDGSGAAGRGVRR